jgi:hypothetical protein
LANQRADYEKKIAALEKDKKGLEQTVQKVVEQVAPINVLDFDKPKGKVVASDRTGRMPFINLGSADNLRPQLTFTVYGVDPDGKPTSYPMIGPDGRPVIGEDKKPVMEGKASLEVVSVLGEHLAQAHVTHLRDEGRDPILRGDLLYNPAWDPNQRPHVAIAGLVDLTGEGSNDMAEFQRTLERQGIIVDAWLDLKDLTVKGKGISHDTDYLILGAIPEIPGAEAAKDTDARARRLQKIIELRNNLQKDAERHGVPVISLRKYLAMTGFQVTRGTRSALPANYGTLPEEKKPPKAEKPANGDKAPADEKKDK